MISGSFPPPSGGTIVYQVGELVLHTTPAGELCATQQELTADTTHACEQLLDRDDVRRLIVALEFWLEARFVVTPAGRAAALEEGA